MDKNMSKPATVTFSSIKLPRTGTCVLLVPEGGRLGKTGRVLDKKAHGLLKRAMKLQDFTGEARSSIQLVLPPEAGPDRVIIMGVGQPAENSADDWVNLGGRIAGLAMQAGAQQVGVVCDLEQTGEQAPADVAAWIAAGLSLRTYSFDKYKTKKKKKNKNKKSFPKYTVLHAKAAAARQRFMPQHAVVQGVFLARDLVNEPANHLGPVEFARTVKELASLGVRVEILKEKKLRKLGMGALLAVGQGSARPSRVAVMQWHGAEDTEDAPLAFVGKGVVFDTGGISLKPGGGMEDMKGDMGGAACVTGLMHALAARKARVNAVGIIGLVENMPGSRAYRPGDVLTSMSGQTIEVLNTDAEGRLVLADLLWYAKERFAPKAMINLATLTGAILVALGKEYAGLFSNDDGLSKELITAGRTTGEKVWRLPLGPKYDKLIDSKIADMKNIGGRLAGSITAAQFLQRFVGDVPWAHLDVAGMAMAAQSTDVNASWGSGFGVRLLDELVRAHYEDMSA